MDLIERYIYAVTSRLPEQQRKEIRLELQGLIQDMLEERGLEKASEQAVSSVLLELGPPEQLAAKYRGYDRYLIGPMLFESYITTLKVVLGSVLVVMTCLFALEPFLEGAKLQSAGNWASGLSGYIGNIWMSGIQAAAWVTAIFAVIEYQKQRKPSSGKKKAWAPTDLPLLPGEANQYKIGQSVSSIFFTVLFVSIFMQWTNLIGVWRIDGDGYQIIPFINEATVRSYLPLVWISAAGVILNHCVRILFRRRTAKTFLLDVLISAVNAVLISIMLSDSAIWNPNFVQQLQQGDEPVFGSDFVHTLSNSWNSVSNWSVGIVILFTLLGMFSEYSKWRRASKA